MTQRNIGVQDSLVGFAAGFTRLASTKVSRVWNIAMFTTTNEVSVTHSWSVSTISAVSVTMRYDIVVQGLLHDLLAWLVTRDSRQWNESSRM